MSAILVYSQLAEQKYVLGKPHCLRENEDLLLRMDMTELGAQEFVSCFALNCSEAFSWYFGGYTKSLLPIVSQDRS